MAMRASDRVTLAVLPSPSYVRTYYLKQSSTLNPPAVPTTNPPASPWSTTEPTFTPNATETVYTVMLTAYGPNRNDYGPVQKSASFEAAKQAYNQAIAAGSSADAALLAAQQAQTDLANLQIGGRNYLLHSAELTGSLASPAPGLTVSTDEDGHFQVVAEPINGNYVSGIGLGDSATNISQHLSEGDAVVFSVDIKSPDSQFVPTLYFGDGWSGGYNALVGTMGEGWSRFYATSTAGSKVWRPHVGFQHRPGTYVFRRAKLERGNKATDWTPAPEDVDAAIGAATVLANNAQLAANGKNVNTSVTVAVGTLESNLPVPADPPTGQRIPEDRHFVIDTNGTVLAEWKLNTSRKWDKIHLGDFLLRSLDVGKLTAMSGSFATAVINKMVVQLARLIEVDADKITTGTLSANRIDAMEIAGAIATFLELRADQITSGKITAGQVDTNSIWAQIITAGKIITGDLIAERTISADKLIANTITAESGVIANAAINTANIKDLAVNTAKIANLNVTEGKIANLAVTNAKIKDLNAAKITSGFIDAARIDARSISTEKLLIGSFDNVFFDPYFEDTRGYAPATVVGGSLKVLAGQTVNPSWLVMNIDTGENYNVSFTKTGTGNVTFSIYSSATHNGTYTATGDSFNTFTDEGDFEFKTSGVAGKPYIKWVITNTTATSYISAIKVQKVFSGIRLEDGAITTEKITAGAVVSESIASEAITTSHIGAGTIIAEHIGAGVVNASHIGAGTITGEHIATGSLTSNEIMAGTITTENLAAGAVTFDKIALNSIRGEHFDSGSISKNDFVNASDSELGTIIERSHAIAESVIIDPGKITLSSERIPIGGQNLLINSLYDITLPFTEISAYFGNNPPTNGETVTLSFKAEPGDGITGFRVYNSGNNSLGTPDITEEYRNSSGIYNLTFNWVHGGTNSYLRLSFIGTPQATKYTYIDWIKLERGTKATPWEDGSATGGIATSLSLTSTRQTFTVDGKEVVYIDSEEESMNIKNVVVERSIKVGNHIIDSLSNDITIFTWSGEA